MPKAADILPPEDPEIVEQGQLKARKIDGEVARSFVVQRVDRQRQ